MYYTTNIRLFFTFFSYLMEIFSLTLSNSVQVIFGIINKQGVQMSKGGG